MINTWIHNALKKLASFFTRVSLKQEQVSKTAVLLNASRLNVSKRSLYTSQVNRNRSKAWSYWYYYSDFGTVYYRDF